MWTAVLDSSGPDLEFIGIVMGQRSELKRVLKKLSRGEIHMRAFSRERRAKTARAFLGIVSRRYSAILISVRTQMKDVLSELRSRMPFVPSYKLRRLCFKALAQILIGIISQYPITEIIVDAEIEALWRALGNVRLLRKGADLLVGLADILAWIDNKIAKGEWTLSEKHALFVKRLNVKNRLRTLVGLG